MTHRAASPVGNMSAAWEQHINHPKWEDFRGTLGTSAWSSEPQLCYPYPATARRYFNPLTEVDPKDWNQVYQPI